VDGGQALEELKPLVKEPRGSKQRMTDSLVDNATVAFKIGEVVDYICGSYEGIPGPANTGSVFFSGPFWSGEDLTNDQVAAAEQLLRTCADFKARLDNNPHELFF
jgi:hypothetical protein